MYGMERRVKGAEDAYDLAILAREIDDADLSSPNVKRSMLNTLMSKAKRLRLRPGRYKPKGMDERDWYFRMLKEHPIQKQRDLFENPKKTIRLKNPKKMPNPGPMAWFGTTLEWKWDGGKWRAGKKKWLFLWSPKYKAVVAIKIPKLDSLGKVSRKGGAAKMFERFMSRDPNATYEAEIPACKLVKLGKADHIVYRSDKWKHKKETEDYIHDFGKGVNIYCGPSKKNPEVFLCFGGKLTATERGLVF